MIFHSPASEYLKVCVAFAITVFTASTSKKGVRQFEPEISHKTGVGRVVMTSGCVHLEWKQGEANPAVGASVPREETLPEQSQTEHK